MDEIDDNCLIEFLDQLYNEIHDRDIVDFMGDFDREVAFTERD